MKIFVAGLLQSTAGCQRLRDGLELHPLPS
jgi:hypothetical protein